MRKITVELSYCSMGATASIDRNEMARSAASDNETRILPPSHHRQLCFCRRSRQIQDLNRQGGTSAGQHDQDSRFWRKGIKERWVQAKHFSDDHDHHVIVPVPAAQSLQRPRATFELYHYLSCGGSLTSDSTRKTQRRWQAFKKR